MDDVRTVAKWNGTWAHSCHRHNHREQFAEANSGDSVGNLETRFFPGPGLSQSRKKYRIQALLQECSKMIRRSETNEAKKRWGETPIISTSRPGRSNQRQFVLQKASDFRFLAPIVSLLEPIQLKNLHLSLAPAKSPLAPPRFRAIPSLARAIRL